MCRVFIGSSRESQRFAKAIQVGLRDVARCQIWSQGFFRPGSTTLEELSDSLQGFDFGVFVFAPDDISKIRDETASVVRDNVLFELGMFVGKLGRFRAIFAMPERRQFQDFHLPSDLNGVTAVTYEPGDKNVETGVSQAVFKISEAIRELGPLKGKSTQLLNVGPVALPIDFREVRSHVYKNHEKTGQRAAGTLSLNQGILQIDRTNSHGRFEIQYRPQDKQNPSFKRLVEPIKRLLHISCDVKSEGASRKVRFVAKDEEEDKWLASQSFQVQAGDWKPIEFHFRIDASKDFLFRIDDEEVSAEQSKLFIRNLLIEDERL